jgi:Tfp pilus assembly protein FimT
LIVSVSAADENDGDLIANATDVVDDSASDSTDVAPAETSSSNLSSAPASPVVKINASKATKTYTQNYTTYKFKVYDANTKKGLANQKVYVRVGDDYKKTLYSNSKGIVKVKIKDLDAGRHTIVIKVGTVVKKTSIKIKPLKLKVKAKKVTARLGQNKKFKIVLTDKKGNRIKDDVDLKIRIYTGKKYRTFEIETNRKGVAYFKLSRLSRGSHKVVIKSDDDEYIANKVSKIVIR